MCITNLYYYWEGATGILGALKALAKGRAIRISLGKFYPTCMVIIEP